MNNGLRTVSVLILNEPLATDELRKEEAKFFTLHCQNEREKQLLEKRTQAERQIMEEQIYAQLWALDLKKKEERDRIEAMEKKKLVGDTMAVLDWQKNTRGFTKAQEQNLTQ